MFAPIGNYICGGPYRVVHVGLNTLYSCWQLVIFVEDPGRQGLPVEVRDSPDVNS